MKTHIKIPWFVLFFSSLVFVESTLFAADKGDFFNLDHYVFEKPLMEIYRDKKLVPSRNYPQLRRIYARNIAKRWDFAISSEWGKGEDPFLKWLENRPELLEEFLLAIDGEKDDVPAAMRILKLLCTRHPEKVEKYPELAIAVAIVWDQPETTVLRDCRAHYHATEAPDPAGAEDNFLYYADESAPFHKRIEVLPWEFLMFIVCNKTSLEERRWIWKQYGNKKTMLGLSYSDPPFAPRWDYSEPGPEHLYSEVLVGKPYTSSNIRKYGAVCSGQSDYALNVCRTLGVPAFQGIGWPDYIGGHYWVEWLEMREISPKTKQITFTLAHDGKDAEYRKDRITHSPYPNWGDGGNVGEFLLQLVPAGKDRTAYRHGQLLMRCYNMIVLKAELTPKQQLELLTHINDVCPANLKAWKKIAALGTARHFDKKSVAQVKKLHVKMVDEFLFSPGFLPELSREMLSFPEIRSEEKKLYNDMFAKFERIKRPDLIFASAGNYSESLQKQQRHRDAFDMLATFALRYSEELSHIAPIFNELDSLASHKPKEFDKPLVEFYVRFLAKLMNSESRIPSQYKIDVLKRAQTHFEKMNKPELVAKTVESIKKVEHEQRVGDEVVRGHVANLKKAYDEYLETVEP